MTEPTQFRLPPRIDMGAMFNGSIGQLILHFHDYTEYLNTPEGAPNYARAQEELEYLNPLRRRTIMGLVIPDFQRPLVWNQDQMIKFIESMWLGLPLGSFSVNQDPTFGNGNPTVRNILIDGQQRMYALEQYLTDAFPVFGLLYSDLNVVEKRKFAAITWNNYQTESDSEQFVRDYYNRLNFGGVAHTEEQRA